MTRYSGNSVWLALSVIMTVLSLSSTPVSSASFGPGVSTNVTTRGLVIGAGLTARSILDNYRDYSSSHLKHRSFQPGMTLGYVTPWNAHGYEVAKLFALKFTHVSPVWFQLKLEQAPTSSTDGKPSKIGVRITGTHDVDRGWIASVKAAGSNPQDSSRVAIVPRVLVELAPGTDPRVFLALARRPKLQELITKKILNLIVEYDLDGIVLEMVDAWIYATHLDQSGNARNNLNLFLMQLGASLHSHRNQKQNGRPDPKQLIFVVRPYMRDAIWFQGFDFERTSKYVDYFSLMTYDHSPSAPGPLAPLPWVRSSVESLLGKDGLSDFRKRRKVLLGLPFYGYRHPSGQQSSAVLGHELIDALEANPDVSFDYDPKTEEHHVVVRRKEDGKRETIYYPTLQFLKARMDLAKELGLGLSIWEIGQGLDYFYDLL